MSEYMPKFYTLEDMTQKDLNKLALERNIFASEIENLKKENKELEEIINIKECQLEEIQQNKTDYTQVNILEMKLDKLHSIIKEVREYIENNTLYFEDYDYDEEDNLIWSGAYDYKAREELLEILDKENK